MTPHALLLLLIFSLCSCSPISNVLTSGTAYIVSRNSEINAKRNKRFNVLGECTREYSPDAYAISTAIESGAAIDDIQNRLLNELEEDAELEPFPRHHISYGFLIIADIMDDSRAAQKKASYARIYPAEQLKEIEELIHYKYYLSYLKKCFSVPLMYQKHTPIRDQYRQ